MFKMEARTNGDKDCREAQIKVRLNLSCEENLLSFIFKCEYQHDAQLLVAHINKELDNALKSIRRESYNTGWKDAKSKKTCKKTTFGSSFRNDYVGW